MPRQRPKYIELLDDYRQRLDWSWAKVDREAGLQSQPDARAKWITGETKAPPFSEIVRIARALDVPPDDLFAAVIDDEVYTLSLERRGTIEERLVELENRLDPIVKSVEQIGLKLAGLTAALESPMAADVQELQARVSAVEEHLRGDQGSEDSPGSAR